MAEYLSNHNKVSRVIYAGLDEGEAGERANKYLKGGHGALCGIELKGIRNSTVYPSSFMLDAVS